jgi:signal transduction histidine kinase
MRERIEMIGGTFRIDSVPGESTTVEIGIPALKEVRSGREGELPLSLE